MEDSLKPALYVVATPIGNLEDITLRALRILKSADYIAAEDTRHSRILLDHYGIQSRLFSLHDHNERNRRVAISEFILSGKSVALISDAGTPLISDPGYHVAAYCREQGILVIPVPGPSAVISALSASGLPTDRFFFGGFLPVKSKALREELEHLRLVTATSVYYESPRRILDTLAAVAEVLGSDRRVVLGRELTKTFESFYDLPAGEMIAFLREDPCRQKGEFVLMIAGATESKDDIPQEVLSAFRIMLTRLPLNAASALCAEIFNVKKNELYRRGLEFARDAEDHEPATESEN